MDAASIVQIVTAATAFMAALSTAAVLIIKELRSVAEKVEASNAKVGIVAEKADAIAVDQNARLSVIHDNGNAHLELITGKLAESEKRNEALVMAMKESVEKSDRESTARIEKLELLLTMSKQQEASAPVPISTGAMGVGADAVQKIEIQQPETNPVPVVGMKKASRKSGERNV